MPGEFELINWIAAQHPPTPFVPVPQGDDLAVLKWDAADLLLVGVDQVLDGVHFDSALHPPRAIGRKVMNRNLSDCAAMACLPAAAVATVALPQGAGLDYAKELYLGLRDAADPVGCVLVGGDTGSWPGKLVMTVTILGKSAGARPITRGGASPGDGIYVTGPLGGSILGRHMTFSPRIDLARRLANTGQITAMIDLSDGLSRDLGHLLNNHATGATLYAANIPIHEDATILSQRDGLSPLQHALNDGEDYELLFTAAGQIPPELARNIGVMESEPGLRIQIDNQRQPLRQGGWQHGL